MEGMDGRHIVTLLLGIGVGYGIAWIQVQPKLERLTGQVAALRGRVARLVNHRQTPTLALVGGDDAA